MATSIVIRGSIHEMVYSKFSNKKPLLMKGRIGEYLFEIDNCWGNHPAAYIHLPKDYPLENIARSEQLWKDYIDPDDLILYFLPLYDVVRLPVHGGLTYNGHSDSKKHGCVLGWDYNHSGDFSGNLDCGEKKWTVAEVLEEVKEAVSYLKCRKRKA